MILSALFGGVITLTAATATKKTTIGDTDNCQLTNFVNSASTALPIGLPPKGQSFTTLQTYCQWGINAAVAYCHCNLIPLWSVGQLAGWPVINKGCQALGGFPPKGLNFLICLLLTESFFFARVQICPFFLLVIVLVGCTGKLGKSSLTNMGRLICLSTLLAHP
jgi:hypothetical protein